MKKRNLIVGIMSVVVVFSGMVYGTFGGGRSMQVHALLPRTDVNQMLQGSDAVVLGRVAEQRVAWEPSDIRVDEEDIMTTSIIEVGQVLHRKVSVPSVISVKSIGGTIGKNTMGMTGTAFFEEGEDVLVFLDMWEDGTFRVHGLTQGKYEIGEGGKIKNKQSQSIVKDVFRNEDVDVEFLEERVRMFEEENTPQE